MSCIKFLVLFGGLAAGCVAQERFQTGEFQGFTRSPTEHIINRFEKPITAREASGVVVSKSDSQPLANAVFEVRGPGTESKVQGTTTDQRGHFRLKHLRAGEYIFKVTLNGFQSVVGRLTISRPAAGGEPIRIELSLGV